MKRRKKDPFEEKSLGEMGIGQIDGVEIENKSQVGTCKMEIPGWPKSLQSASEDNDL